MLLLTLLLFPLIPSAFAQQAVVYDAGHNVTTIYGTWSSGSQRVVTGADFASPANLSFFYPPVTGLSYSFSDDGYYEVARYRMSGNGSQPNCITGVMNWCHGTYTLNSNGSITLTPFGDGYQQIQDPCAPTSNFIQNYNDTELYELWNIYQDPQLGFVLQLYDSGGTPLPPQPQLSSSPNMLPTQPLRNVTTANVLVVSAGERSWSMSWLTYAFSLAVGLGITSSLL